MTSKQEAMNKIKKINRNSSNNEPIKNEPQQSEPQIEEPIIPAVHNGSDELEREFPTMTIEEPEFEEPEEDSMDDVNRRLTDAILSLPNDERTLFKVC